MGSLRAGDRSCASAPASFRPASLHPSPLLPPYAFLHPPLALVFPKGLQSLPLAGLPCGSTVSFDFGVLDCKRADPTGDQA